MLTSVDYIVAYMTNYITSYLSTYAKYLSFCRPLAVYLLICFYMIIESDNFFFLKDNSH